MTTGQAKVRHVVAWVPALQWVSCLVLWLVFGIASLMPQLDLPIRAIAFAGFAAASCRTLVVLEQLALLPPWHGWRGIALGADAALMTGLLDITGGPLNPFLVIYVAYVWLAAVTLTKWWGFAVGAIVAGGFGWLVLDHLQAGIGEHHRLSDFPTHLFTMWFTGVTAAELVAHYVGRARIALAQRQDEVDRAREVAARSEHLVSLMTLAAGAAHELSTPLATIAVAAGELRRNARTLSPNNVALEEDALLIQTAVSRCQSILDGMSGRATGLASSTAEFTPEGILKLAQQDLSRDRQSRLRVDIAAEAVLAKASTPDASRALSSLLKNAFDASAHADEVHLAVALRTNMIRFVVRDHGSGMTEETRRRAGEPFYTTKPAGHGLGLGLFLARTIAEQAGGTLLLENDRGTTAILEIPLLTEAISR